jgi:hypothetical protein
MSFLRGRGASGPTLLPGAAGAPRLPNAPQPRRPCIVSPSAPHSAWRTPGLRPRNEARARRVSPWVVRQPAATRSRRPDEGSLAPREGNRPPARGSAHNSEGGVSPRVRDGAPRKRGPCPAGGRVSVIEGGLCAFGGRDSPRVRRVRDPRGQGRPRARQRPALERAIALSGGRTALPGGVAPLGCGKAPSGGGKAACSRALKTLLATLPPLPGATGGPLTRTSACRYNGAVIRSFANHGTE